jgi:hypothetical protein
MLTEAYTPLTATWWSYPEMLMTMTSVQQQNTERIESFVLLYVYGYEVRS